MYCFSKSQKGLQCWRSGITERASSIRWQSDSRNVLLATSSRSQMLVTTDVGDRSTELDQISGNQEILHFSCMKLYTDTDTHHMKCLYPGNNAASMKYHIWRTCTVKRSKVKVTHEVNKIVNKESKSELKTQQLVKNRFWALCLTRFQVFVQKLHQRWWLS